jgi:hypothetical protein
MEELSELQVMSDAENQKLMINLTLFITAYVKLPKNHY